MASFEVTCHTELPSKQILFQEYLGLADRVADWFGVLCWWSHLLGGSWLAECAGGLRRESVWWMLETRQGAAAGQAACDPASEKPAEA